MNTQEETKFEGTSHAGDEKAGRTESQSPQDESERAGSDQAQALIDELNVLGAKFAAAIDAAWNSEQRKRLEEDLRKGIVSTAQSLEQHLKDFSRREETQKVLDKAKGASFEQMRQAEALADKVRSSKVSQEVAAALTQGLRALSEQLDKLAKDLRAHEAAKEAAADAPAGDDDPTATSEARRNRSNDAPSTKPDSDSGEDIPIQRA